MICSSICILYVYYIYYYMYIICIIICNMYYYTYIICIKLKVYYTYIICILHVYYVYICAGFGVHIYSTGPFANSRPFCGSNLCNQLLCRYWLGGRLGFLIACSSPNLVRDKGCIKRGPQNRPQHITTLVIPYYKL